MKTYAGGLKRGDFIMHNGEIWNVQKVEFYSPGKGSALTHAKIKNVARGKIVDQAFKSAEDVETVDVNSIEMQYLYKDAENAYFMNNQTFEQTEVPLVMVGDQIQFYKEGQNVYVFVHDEKALSVRGPLAVRLKVTESEDAARGDTVANVKKSITLETGAKILAPAFIKVGETVVVNPETGEYVERDSMVK